jgi:hypothetical protein
LLRCRRTWLWHPYLAVSCLGARRRSKAAARNLYHGIICSGPHTFSNPFEPAKFVGTLTPDLYVEYFRDLSKLPVDDNGLLNPADIGRAMARYATEVVR